MRISNIIAVTITPLPRSPYSPVTNSKWKLGSSSGLWCISRQVSMNMYFLSLSKFFFFFFFFFFLFFIFLFYFIFPFLVGSSPLPFRIIYNSEDCGRVMAGSDGRSPPAASNFRADASDPVDLVQSISNVSRMVWQPNRTDESTPTEWTTRPPPPPTPLPPPRPCPSRPTLKTKFQFIYRRHGNSEAETWHCCKCWR